MLNYTANSLWSVQRERSGCLRLNERSACWVYTGERHLYWLGVAREARPLHIHYIPRVFVCATDLSSSMFIFQIGVMQYVPPFTADLLLFSQSPLEFKPTPLDNPRRRHIGGSISTWMRWA